jgi:sulfur carrier protein ThiS
MCNNKIQRIAVNIIYNGNNYFLGAPCTIYEFLEKTGKSTIPMMVKLNGIFLSKKVRGDVLLKEGDSLLVILFMGGG